MERIICLLIGSLLALYARDEFIFFAELSNKNFILVHQSEHISPAMTKSENFDELFACELYYDSKDLNYLVKTELGSIDDDMPRNLKLRFLNAHKAKLLECFTQAQVKVQDLVQGDFLHIQTRTFIKILPLRFRINFANDRALIYELVKR